MVVKELLDKVDAAGEVISRIPDDKYIAVLTHYDADGLSAGGALLRLLNKLGKRFIVRAVTDLNEDSLKKFFKVKADLHIISDLGSGEIDRIRRLSTEYKVKELIILDHHKISGEPGDILLVNPELYGIDGGSADCASILSSFLGYQLTKDPYFTVIGLVGATGDMQIFDPKDLTLRMLNESLSNSYAKKIRDFIFFQNRSLPIFKAITWTFLPYIPSFSGRDDIGLSLVKKAGIEYTKSNGSYKTVDDLNDFEKNRLLEEILHYILGLGVDDLKPRDLMIEVILFIRESHYLLRYSQDFSNVVSASGRLGKDYLGILVSAGSRDWVLNDVEEVYESRRKLLAKYLSLVERRKKIHDNVVVVDLRGEDVNPRFAGTISTILSKSLVYSDKVVYVILSRDDKIKVSARAPRSLVEKGLNLSEIMGELASKYGGHGGGHNVAAGAVIEGDDGNLVKFLVESVKSYI